MGQESPLVWAWQAGYRLAEVTLKEFKRAKTISRARKISLLLEHGIRATHSSALRPSKAAPGHLLSDLHLPKSSIPDGDSTRDHRFVDPFWYLPCP